jgi:transposase
MLVTREELKQLIRTTPFTQIGKQFGVSDNTIRKWCDKYNLPRKVSEIKKYSDEDWSKI